MKSHVSMCVSDIRVNVGADNNQEKDRYDTNRNKNRRNGIRKV